LWTIQEADVAEVARRADPFVAFRFEVRVDDLPLGGFSECGGLQLETEVMDYAEGGLNTHLHKLPVRTKQSPIRLKRGVVDRVLWDWYADLVGGLVVRRNGSILVHDPSGATVVAQWQFRRAYPVKWIGPELNATQNQVAVETIELVHEGLERMS
jgi:phage tail-like protein